MGTVHSSARSTSSSSGKRSHGNGNFSSKDMHYNYPSPNHSGSTINHHTVHQQHLHPQSPTSTHHTISSSSPASPSSTLQKAFSRRRSSNQTTDTQSCHGSMGSHHGHSKHSHHSHHHHHHDSHHLPSHAEEADEFRYFGGRRYHNTSSLYMLPNDTQEVDRLNDQHYIFKAVLGKNIHVPIPENGRVMDMGCGAGTWMMDMATEMGTVHFVGADISNIYPTAIHPRNCSFYRENIIKGVLSQPNSSFDVVFQRNVAPGLTFQNWQAVIAEAYRLLKPGGSFESVETDVFVHQGGPQTNAIFDHLRVSMATRNVDPTVVRDLRTLMISAGFVDVNTKEYCVPLGEWGGQGGKLFLQNMQAIMQSASAVLARAGNVTEEYILQLVQGMMQETSRDRAYQMVYVTCGKKPL